MNQMQELKTGDVYKFTATGQKIEGIYMGYEESKQYPQSYAVKMNVEGTLQVVFVSAIVIDMLNSNDIIKGKKIQIEFLGKIKTKDGKRTYNNYKVYA